MAEKSERKPEQCLRMKETYSIEEVNKYIKNGWQLFHATSQFGRYLFMLIKD